MSITGIIMAAVIVGGTGLFIGIFLGLADKKLTVKVDEKEEEFSAFFQEITVVVVDIRDVPDSLPHRKGEAPVDQCPVGGAPGCSQDWRDHGTGSKRNRTSGCFCKMCGNL